MPLSPDHCKWTKSWRCSPSLLASFPALIPEKENRATLGVKLGIWWPHPDCRTEPENEANPLWQRELHFFWHAASANWFSLLTQQLNIVFSIDVHPFQVTQLVAMHMVSWAVRQLRQYMETTALSWVMNYRSWRSCFFIGQYHMLYFSARQWLALHAAVRHNPISYLLQVKPVIFSYFYYQFIRYIRISINGGVSMNALAQTWYSAL